MTDGLELSEEPQIILEEEPQVGPVRRSISDARTAVKISDRSERKGEGRGSDV